MKKPHSVLLYPGVVLRSNGMIIIPSLPKTQPRHTSTFRVAVNASPKPAARQSPKRKPA